eukprot:CAMPEP_0119300172 /NCGR_PEP_ID=MMETSP1333-20130426/2173_1 /TAXON_ID=418940 /ORGANISM="Scyphosphaera apsteinii, Strain RCC1455" /LENGTH=158 /DNA_ID=CAMNT_0007301859 /DNA_START=20 /DNA_END=493 /DNA_ORIENTATION=+
MDEGVTELDTNRINVTLEAVQVQVDEAAEQLRQELQNQAAELHEFYQAQFEQAEIQAQKQQAEVVQEAVRSATVAAAKHVQEELQSQAAKLHEHYTKQAKHAEQRYAKMNRAQITIRDAVARANEKIRAEVAEERANEAEQLVQKLQNTEAELREYYE